MAASFAPLPNKLQAYFAANLKSDADDRGGILVLPYGVGVGVGVGLGVTFPSIWLATFSTSDALTA